MKRKIRAAKHLKNKRSVRRGITVALLMACFSWGVIGKAKAKPIEPSNGIFMSHADMLKITATYPKNLITKDGAPELAVVVKNIQDGITAIQTKGTAVDTQLTKTQNEIKSLNEALYGTKDAEGKELTKGKIAEIQAKFQKDFDELQAKLKKNPAFNLGSADTKSFGDLIMHGNKELSKMKDTSGLVYSIKLSKGETHRFLTKASTVTETSSLTGDVIAPLRLDEIYRDPLRPVHIREFMNMGRMSSSTVLFNTLTEETDGSSTTAEGSSATQSDFALTANEVVARKINTYLNISKEMMDDADFVMSYLQTQVTGRILMKEDTQVLTGNGTAPNLVGIQGKAAAFILGPIGGTSPTNINYYDVLMQAVTQARVSYYVPNYILVHPYDYQTIITARDTYGRYQFEQNIKAGQNGFYIGGALLVPNTAVSQGTFYVGDFLKGAQLFQRDDLEITFSTQNASNFIQGLVTVLVEERLANIIYRPNAFIYGSSFTNAMISGS
jgi:HK97 family phage major capsid protein